MSKPNRYPEKKGRSSSTRFTRLDHRLLSSPAYRALSTNARALLVELATMENGSNNGTGLFLSVRDAADRIGVKDPGTAVAAFRELEEMGFVDKAADAHFAVKAGEGSRARVWRLTWLAVDGRRGPSNEFAAIEPLPQTAARQRMERGLRALKRWKRAEAEEKSPVGNNPTHNANRVGNIHIPANRGRGCDSAGVGIIPTRNANNGEIPPKPIMGKFPTHTAVPAAQRSIGQAIGAQALEIDPATAPDPVSLRARLIDHLRPGGLKGEWGAAGRLGTAAGIGSAELSRFRHGNASLTPAKRVALSIALDGDSIDVIGDRSTMRHVAGGVR